MTYPPHPRHQLAGVGYALLAVYAGISACWHLSFDDVGLGMWMLATACLAARCSSTLQTIAHQHARLTDPRRSDGRGRQ